jgi:hypothetical protein
MLASLRCDLIVIANNTCTNVGTSPPSNVNDDYDAAKLARLVAFFAELRHINNQTLVADNINNSTTQQQVNTDDITKVVVETAVAATIIAAEAANVSITSSPTETNGTGTEAATTAPAAPVVTTPIPTPVEVKTVTLYCHPSSTSSRAVLLLVYQHRIPLTIKIVDLQLGM